VAWTSPRTWVAGETVTAALLNTHVRDNLKAIGDPYAAYAPTYTNLTIGNGVVTAQYIQAGKHVHGYYRLTVGTTTAFSGVVGVTFPAGANVVLHWPNTTLGSAFLFDTSSGLTRTGAVYTQSATVMGVVVDNGGGALSNTVPWTWATGDTLSFQFSYEAA
jgi:hypothetical protein